MWCRFHPGFFRCKRRTHRFLVLRILKKSPHHDICNWWLYFQVFYPHGSYQRSSGKFLWCHAQAKLSCVFSSKYPIGNLFPADRRCQSWRPIWVLVQIRTYHKYSESRVFPPPRTYLNFQPHIKLISIHKDRKLDGVFQVIFMQLVGANAVGCWNVLDFPKSIKKCDVKKNQICPLVLSARGGGAPFFALFCYYSYCIIV